MRSCCFCLGGKKQFWYWYVEVCEQGCELGVEFVVDDCDCGIVEVGEVGVWLVDCELGRVGVVFVDCCL